MARIIINKEKMPKEVKVCQESVWICMCGTSKGKPFCDGSHKQVADEEEGKLYKYENGKKIELKIEELR